MGVAVPAPAAAGDDHLVAGVFQVAEHVAAVAVADEGAGGTSMIRSSPPRPKQSEP